MEPSSNLKLAVKFSFFEWFLFFGFMDDADICRVACEELRELIGIVKDPMWTMVTRWPLSMPQYMVGHMQQVEQIQSLAAEHEGLSLMGNAYSGVGLPDCVRSGESAAERVMERVHQGDPVMQE